jgi:hypothetical protein
MSGRSCHGAGPSDVVHSADEAPAEAVGGRSTRPDRDRNRDQTSLVLCEISRKPLARCRFLDCDPAQSADHFVLNWISERPWRYPAKGGWSASDPFAMRPRMTAICALRRLDSMCGSERPGKAKARTVSRSWGSRIRRKSRSARQESTPKRDPIGAEANFATARVGVNADGRRLRGQQSA